LTFSNQIFVCIFISPCVLNALPMSPSLT
jgi:hypothetical protein